MLAFMNKFHNREDGFTLVELLIVVLIIGILAAIAIPVYLGLQNQAKNNSTKQDVNSTVHRIQVALTEGQAVSDAATANTDSANRSDGTQVVTTVQSDGKNFTVVGTQSGTNFTYTYDSTTGQFTEGTANIALGGGSTGVAPAITSSSSLPVATASKAYSGFTVTATGTAPLTFTATGLPTGMVIDSATGVISGTPSTAGDYTPTIKVTGTGAPAGQNATIHVNANAGTVTLAATTLTNGTTGQSYSQTITSSSTGTAGTVVYTLTGGSLPAGLTLSSGGVISGTPTASGTFQPTVTATKTTAEGEQATDVKQYSLVVTAGPAYAENFESYSVGDSAGWSTLSGSHSTSVATGNAYDGTKSLSITTTSGGRVQGATLTGLTVGKTYTLTVYIKGASGGISIINAGSPRAGANSSSSAYNAVSTTFVYQSGDRIGLYNGSGTTYYDTITIQ